MREEARIEPLGAPLEARRIHGPDRPLLTKAGLHEVDVDVRSQRSGQQNNHEECGNYHDHNGIVSRSQTKCTLGEGHRSGEIATDVFKRLHDNAHYEDAHKQDLAACCHAVVEEA
eukprot:7378116-Prymnesium_polylepis.2